MKMKKALNILLLCPFICCFACREVATELPTLLQAEVLMEEKPDSALLLVQSIKSPAKLSQKEYATWCLLMTEALDKNYNSHTSDSLISIATNYFDRCDGLERKARSWYLMGKVNHGLKQYEKALLYYQKAISYAQSLPSNNQLTLIYSQLAGLYSLQKLYDEALGSAQKALEYAKQAGDTMHLPYIIHLNVGSVCYSLNRMDSAEYYLNRSVNSSSLFTKAEAFSYLYKVAVSRGEYKTAIGYNVKYQLLADSIHAKKRQAEILLLTHTYRQQELKKELEVKVFRMRVFYGGCAVLLLFLLFAGIGVYWERCRGQERSLHCEESILQREKGLRLNGEVLFSENKQQIAWNKIELLKNKEDMQSLLQRSNAYETALLRMDSGLLEKEIALQEKEDELLKQKIVLFEKENEVIESKNKLLLLRYQRFNESGFPERIKEAKANKQTIDNMHPPFKNSDFKALKSELNKCFDNFTGRLQNEYPVLTELELDICCLIKAGGKTANIAFIVGMQSNSVTKKRQNISDKFHLNTKSLELFLTHF